MPKVADKRAAKVETKTVGKKKAKKDSDDDAYVAKQSKGDKVKDPNAPKRPMSSYFLFMNAKRAGVKEAEPDLKFGELTKKLTEKWKALTDKEKKIYEDAALVERKRYETEMREAGLLKEKKDENEPKRPQSAFFLFQAEAREKIKKENPDIKQTDLLKKTGEEWRNLDAKKKAVYEKKAGLEKERYAKEKEAYLKTKEGDAAGDKRPAKKGAAAGGKKAKKGSGSSDDEEDTKE